MSYQERIKLEQPIILNDRSIITLQGEKIGEFLQKITSQNVNEIRKQEGQYGLFLTPQGKVLYDFFLYDITEKQEILKRYIESPAVEDFQKLQPNLAIPQKKIDQEELWLLECDSNFVNEIIVLLQKYKLRAKISIHHNTDIKVALCFDSIRDLSLNLDMYFDSRHSSLPDRLIINHSKTIINTKDINDRYKNLSSKHLDEYLELHYKLKLPIFGRDFFSNEYFPFDLGLQNFRAISMNKGCYVGQEVITRTMTRGAMRKSVYKLKSNEIIDNIVNHNEEIFLKNQVSDKSINNIILNQENLDEALRSELSSNEVLSNKKIGNILSMYSKKTCLAVLREINLEKNFYLASGECITIDE